MNAIAVDDEQRALRMMQVMFREIEEVKLEAVFSSAAGALDYLQGHKVDVVFLDVSMPGRDGISLAREIRAMPCPPKLVFVTGHEEYALDAWGVDAVDYILKPYRLEHIRHAIARCKSFGPAGAGHTVEARCFPGFDLFVDGIPLKFHNKKAKELLAYLVHCQGEWVATDQIVYNLFTDQDEEAGKKYYNVISYRLRRSLTDAGIGHILETDYGKSRVCADQISCDYYSYLEGRHELFLGDYLQEYSWAEPTVASMVQNQMKE